ncbi:MAG: hypothetical protein P9M08_01790 [Candidatus Erginobacter occultus]|nr:hypothetical protein [Candidatus Erginobacter occultus]
MIAHPERTPRPRRVLEWIDAWLRRPESVINPDPGWKPARGRIGVYAICSVFFLSLFGLSLGASHSWRMSLLSAVKMPLLFLATLGICLPAGFLLNLMLGAGFSRRELAAVYLMGLSLLALIASSLSPIGFFFALTGCRYHFYTFLNLGFLLYAGWAGGRRLLFCGKFLTGGRPAGRRAVFLVLVFLLTAFVGLQLGWTLRPFIGDPERPMTWFRYGDVDRNLYVQQWQNLADLLRSAGK